MERIINPELLFPVLPKYKTVDETLTNILTIIVTILIILLLICAIVESSFSDYAIDILSILWFFTKIPTVILMFTWLLYLTIWIYSIFREYSIDYAIWGVDSILKGKIMEWYNFANMGILYLPGKDPVAIIKGIIAIIFAIFIILFLTIIICILYTPLVILLSIVVALNPFDSEKIHENNPINPLKLIIPFMIIIIVWGGTIYFKNDLFKGLNFLDKGKKK